jgi:hypothetical protein
MTETAEHHQLVIEELQAELEYAQSHAKEEATQEHKSKEIEFYNSKSKLELELIAERDKWESKDKESLQVIEDMNKRLSLA